MTFCTLKGQWKGRRGKRESKSVHSCSLWIKYSYLNQATPQSEIWASTLLPVFWKPCLLRGRAFSQQLLTESAVTAFLCYLQRNVLRTCMGVNTWLLSILTEDHKGSRRFVFHGILILRCYLVVVSLEVARGKYFIQNFPAVNMSSFRRTRSVSSCFFLVSSYCFHHWFREDIHWDPE